MVELPDAAFDLLLHPLQELRMRCESGTQFIFKTGKKFPLRPFSHRSCRNHQCPSPLPPRILDHGTYFLDLRSALIGPILTPSRGADRQKLASPRLAHVFRDGFQMRFPLLVKAVVTRTMRDHNNRFPCWVPGQRARTVKQSRGKKRAGA